jgi:hypothetical protein
MDDLNKADIAAYLAPWLGEPSSDIESAYIRSPCNVQAILARQISSVSPSTNASVGRPICRINGEEAFLKALRTVSLAQALFTLARIYDVGHIAICTNYASAKRGKPHNAGWLRDPCVDVSRLTEGILEENQKFHDDIELMSSDEHPKFLRATWVPVAAMSFDHLPILKTLSALLPGEMSAGKEYAGIGGGGGSDVISASLLGHLLRRSGKEMNLLISTRTWRTGSQGKKGSKLGVKREIHQHSGPAILDNKLVGGTYRIKEETYSEGRDLETVPINHHRDIFVVLDQGEETGAIPEDERAELPEQFRAVLAQCHPLDTVIVVDTGGDVFGGNSPGFSTPDQDIRVQRAMACLSDGYPNLVTAVLAPGVDTPVDAPEKAEKAGGKVYKPTPEEQTLLLDLLAREYQMDGTNPNRFGKTNLCLQAGLRGQRGWTSLNLPEHVVKTWENPWSSFAYIRECMSDIILMPLKDLLPLIDPVQA